MGDVVWGIEVGIPAGGRSRIMLVNGYLESETCSAPGRGGTYEGKGRPNATSPTDELHAGQMPHRDYCPRRPTS